MTRTKEDFIAAAEELMASSDGYVSGLNVVRSFRNSPVPPLLIAITLASSLDRLERAKENLLALKEDYDCEFPDGAPFGDQGASQNPARRTTPPKQPPLGPG